MVVTDTRVHTGDSTSRDCIQQSTVFIPVLHKILKKKLSVRSRTPRRRQCPWQSHFTMILLTLGT